MPLLSLPTLAVLLTLTPAPRAAPESWRPLLAYDEVTVELERSTVHGTGPFTVQLRWTFRDRAASPRAWDAGVRSAVDLVEIDCRAMASRTWSTAAFTRDNTPVAEHTAEAEAPAWERHDAAAMGGLIVRAGCAALAPRG